MYKTTFHVKICSSKKSILTMEGTFALEPPPLEFPFEGGGGGGLDNPTPRNDEALYYYAKDNFWGSVKCRLPTNVG